MASFSATISLLLLVLSVSFHGSFSLSYECIPVMSNMVPCLTYVMIGSFVDEPKTSCCIGLKTVLDIKPVCLCDMLKSGGAMGYTLNVTRASTLPAACNVDAPPVSACGLSTPSPPASSPASSPASPPASSPASPPANA